MLKKLRLKFIAINMSLVLLVLLALFALVYQSTRTSLEQDSIRMLRTAVSEPIRLGGRPGDRFHPVLLPYLVLQEDRDGQLIASGSTLLDISDESILRELFDEALASGAETGVLEEYGLRFCVGRGPWGDTAAFADLSLEHSTLGSLVRTCLIVGGISLAAFLALSVFLARWAVHPVEEAWTQQQQFVADASHELKTPLTVILTNAEILRSPEYDDTARSRAADSVLSMSQQMRGLVESLLELARADNGSVQTSMTNLDFSDLITQGVLPFEAMFFEQDLLLETDIPAGIWVHGSQRHLQEVLEILLDNALKYSQAPGTVCVSLKQSGRRSCQLTVCTPGDPLSREECELIFKRFYRADKVRKMDHSYGLGLSIAQQILREHRGRIHAEGGDHCNLFVVELPVVPPPPSA